MTASASNPSFYGWKNAGLLFFTYMISIGLVNYGYSAIFPAMIHATGWGRGEASLAQTLSMISSAIYAPVVAFVLNKYGGRRALILGMACLLVSLMLLVFWVDTLTQWIIIWGIITPMGLGLAGLMSIQTVLVFWFKAKRTLAFGLAMSGAAVGGFLAQPIFTWLMATTGTWRAGWFAAACFAVVGIAVSHFVRSRPEDIGQFPDGLPPDEIQSQDDKNQKPVRVYRTHDTWTLKQAVRTKALYLIMALMIAHIMAVFIVMSHGVLHFMDQGLTQMKAASAMGFIIFGSGTARIPIGWAGDKFEPRWIATAAFVFMMINMAGIWWAPGFGPVVAFGFLFGFSYGAALVMMGALIGNYYGPEAFASVNGFLNPFMVTSAALVPAGAGYISDTFNTYSPAFALICILLAAAAICAAILKPPSK